jgi:cell wall-associated NlpC family hydrolase
MAVSSQQIAQLMLFDRFVGIPYLDKGRSLVGLDCYGLVRLVFRELRGIELPSYVADYATGADRTAIAHLIKGEIDAWDEVRAGDEIAFDGVLIREAGFPRHIGLVVTPGLMLHVERGETSRIERYRTGTFSHRIAGFYRYRNHA